VSAVVRGMQSKGFLNCRLGSYVLRSMIVGERVLFLYGHWRFSIDLNLREMEMNRDVEKYSSGTLETHMVVLDVIKKRKE